MPWTSWRNERLFEDDELQLERHRTPVRLSYRKLFVCADQTIFTNGFDSFGIRKHLLLSHRPRNHCVVKSRKNSLSTYLDEHECTVHMASSELRPPSCPVPDHRLCRLPSFRRILPKYHPRPRIWNTRPHGRRDFLGSRTNSSTVCHLPERSF